MRDFIIEKKRDPEQEYTLHLFEYCNLRCAFCWQDHENSVGIDTVTNKLDPIEQFLKTETRDSVVFNAMGGEVFAPEIFDDNLLQAYKELSLGIKSIADKYNKTAKVNWVTNLVTTKYKEIDELMEYSQSIGLKAEIVTSYDPRGRFNVNDFMQFKKSMEYFGDRVTCISMLLSSPNIDYILKDKDPYFKYLYESGKYIYFDYYMPDETAEVQAPTPQRTLWAQGPILPCVRHRSSTAQPNTVSCCYSLSPLLLLSSCCCFLHRSAALPGMLLLPCNCH